jgi:hypothetical protein
MKKLFFTAIALVAFSGVSMGNTIADEEVVKENEKEVVVLKKDYWGCAALAQQVYDGASSYDEDLALMEADAAFEECMSPCRPPFRC